MLSHQPLTILALALIVAAPQVGPSSRSERDQAWTLMIVSQSEDHDIAAGVAENTGICLSTILGMSIG